MLCVQERQMAFFARSPFYRFNSGVMIGVICGCRAPNRTVKSCARQEEKKEKKRQKNENLIGWCAAEQLARPRRRERGSLQIKI